VTDGCSAFGGTEGCSLFVSSGFSAGGGSEPDGVALGGSLAVVFVSTTGAAIPMSVRFPGGTALAVAVGGPLLVFGLAGAALGVAAGLSLGVSVTTWGAGMPMSVPTRAVAPSGRVEAVSRAVPATGVLGDRAGTLDDVAGRGGPLAGRGGALDVVAVGGVLPASGGSLPTLLVGAPETGFG
jgi:hypothetical protein